MLNFRLEDLRTGDTQAIAQTRTRSRRVCTGPDSRVTAAADRQQVQLAGSCPDSRHCLEARTACRAALE